MKLITIKDKESERLRKAVPDFDISVHSKKEIVETIKEMRKEMKRAGGVGLSANQVGLDWRVFVAESGSEFFAVFNPKITKMSAASEELEEGCLSVPEVFIPLKRALRVTLEGYDWNGKKVKIKASGILARIFQHETDHLNGKIILDYIKK
jgi:peptide deformylase